MIPNLERRYRETESGSFARSLPSTESCRPARSAEAHRLNRAHATYSSADAALPADHRVSVANALAFFDDCSSKAARGEIAARIVKEIGDRLRFLADVGLDYLTLNRSAETLSGGEAQRIRLASQIGSGLVGVMYILDEPSIGLHQRDNAACSTRCSSLRDLGNTVIVVEHDEEAILAADHVVDLGPGAGVHGGEVIAQGTPQDICDNPASLTGRYLSGNQRIAVPPLRTPADEKRMVTVHKARGNNLKGSRRENSGRPDDLRNRRLRLRQVDAGQRHALCACCTRHQ